jgi:hypothetical protein
VGLLFYLLFSFLDEELELSEGTFYLLIKLEEAKDTSFQVFMLPIYYVLYVLEMRPTSFLRPSLSSLI